VKVIIDDVTYVPKPERPSGEGLLAALETRFDCDIGDDITIRDYLRTLLMTLWEEGEGFSGKRPFGNSGWKYDLYAPLIKGGFVAGELDEDGCIQELDDTIAYAYVLDLILAVFNGVAE
jgi:hypothetical protein